MSKIKIRIKKNEYDEYEVQWIEDGKKNEAKTYYTNSFADAEETKSEIERVLSIEKSRKSCTKIQPFITWSQDHELKKDH